MFSITFGHLQFGGGGTVADHVVVDLLNVVFRTSCNPVYARRRSVQDLIKQHRISVTEAADAFIHRILRTKCNNFSIMLVLDCKAFERTHREPEHVLLTGEQADVDLYIAGDADKFIVDLFLMKEKRTQEDKLPNYGKGDNVFIVTNDRDLGDRAQKAAQEIPEDKRPNVSVVSVPSVRSSHPVVPMVIDILYVRNNGLSYLHPLPR